MYGYVGRDNEGVDWIPSHVWRGLDEEKIVYLSVTAVSLAVLIRRHNFSLSVIEVSNMMGTGVPNFGL